MLKSITKSKYLSKEYLKKPAVLVFFIISVLSLLGIYVAITEKNWDNFGWCVTLYIAYINWFVMWNISEYYRRELFNELDSHMETIHIAQATRHMIVEVVKELGIDYDNATSITLDDIKQHIKELKILKPPYTKEEIASMTPSERVAAAIKDVETRYRDHFYNPDDENN